MCQMLFRTSFITVLVLFSLLLSARDQSVVITKKITLLSSGYFMDSVEIQPGEWDGLLVSFALAVEKYDDFFIHSANLVTSTNNVSMLPECDTNLDRFSFVSKLAFLVNEDLGRLKIMLKPENMSQKEIVVHFYFYGTNPFSPSVEKEKSAFERTCTCQHPDFIPRVEWGQSFNLTDAIYRPPATYTEVSHLIIHHSATANQSNNWPAVVASIFNYHANTNQWQDIGYNWLIDPEGNLYQGRGGGEDVRGAHMCGYNNNTMGVCLLGTFTNTDPDPRALQALEALLAYKACQKNLDPLASDSIVSHTGFMKIISGHRDGCSPNYTECPGNKLHVLLPVLRENCVAFIRDTCGNFSNLEGSLHTSGEEKITFSDNAIRIKNLSGKSFFISDVSGKIIRFFRLYSNDDLVSIEDFLPGYYYVHVVNNEEVLTKKILKI